MAEVTLEVLNRDDAGKGVARKLRAEGKIPAVVYGGHRDPAKISVDRKSVSELISKSEHGVRSIFLLKMSGTDQQRHAMIKDMTVDPISRRVTHIDFVRVIMDELVRVTIPVHITGTAKGVKNSGGILDFQARELHIECLPNAIPDSIDVDVSALDIHEYVRISDLKLPDGVKVFDDADRVIVGVTQPKVEAAAETAEAAVAEPEVATKGKKEE
jgi:large subunit ribosomal protein L25